MINKSEKKTDKTELDIDIIAVIQFLWSKRKLFLKSSGIGVIIGLVIAFSIPKEYTTTVKLMPETNNTASKMGNLGGLAAMAGIDINSGNSQDAYFTRSLSGYCSQYSVSSGTFPSGSNE